MNKPTFSEWKNNPETDFICDAVVMRTDGEKQEIKDCAFSYSFDGERELVTKKGYLISDYFFVSEVSEYKNYRRV